jgi:transposase-like protein
MEGRAELARYWQAHVQGYESSGLSRREYCERHHIRTHQLDYWRRRCHRSTAGAVPAEQKRWIRLAISEEGESGASGGIGLRLGRVEFAVKPGFDRRLLAEVLQVVGSVC